MNRTFLTVAVAALLSLGVSVASADSTRHPRHADHGLKHVTRTHHQAIRPGFAFLGYPVRGWYGPCVIDEGAGRFRPCDYGAQ